MTYTYKYPRPAVTADCVVITKEEQPKVLLIQRGIDPYKGYWAFPGGFMNMDETTEQCAIRELEEDFVVNRGNHRCYIQSAFAIPDEEKRQQETNSLQRTGDSYRKIVVVRDHIVPWFDENGIYYIGLEDFCLEYIDELESSGF
jgi:ADP-ribose pyrophosphatase YjhB (NUDIX family)